MKTLLNTIAIRLLAQAHARAETVMHKQAAARAPYREHYAANAGGWN